MKKSKCPFKVGEWYTTDYYKFTILNIKGNQIYIKWWSLPDNHLKDIGVLFDAPRSRFIDDGAVKLTKLHKAMYEI